jgi:hypothetical protein
MAQITHSELLARRRVFSGELRKRSLLWLIAVIVVGVLLGIIRRYIQSHDGPSWIGVAFTIGWLAFLLGMGVLAAWNILNLLRQLGLVRPRCRKPIIGRSRGQIVMGTGKCGDCGERLIYDAGR